MSRKEDVSGLVSYVDRQNRPHTKPRDSSFDDIKMRKTAKAAANTAQSIAVGVLNTRSRSNPPVPQLSHGNVPRTLHDTDASFTTTTTGTTSRAKSAGDNRRRATEDVTVQAHQGEEAAPEGYEFVEGSEDDDDDEDDEGQELPEHPHQRAKAVRLTPTQGGAPQAMPDGRNWGRISGDTYPETTSGRPSIIDADDHHEPQTGAHMQTHSAQPMIMPERGAGTRLAYSAQHSVPQQSVVPPSSVNDVLKDVNSGFTFGMAASNKMQTNRPQPIQQLPSQPHSTKPMPASTTHRGPSTTSSQVPVRETRRQDTSQQTRPNHHYTTAAPPQQDIRKQQFESVPCRATPEPQGSRPPQQQHQRQSDKAPPAQSVEAPESEMMSEPDDRTNSNMPRRNSIEPHREAHEPAPLDHSPSKIYGMTYTDLKTASFDVDPNVTESGHLSALQPDDPLPKKLEALGPMDLRAKQDYFASLGIEEWEEAGDWFLESFAKLTERFKIARQEKRKIARDFENEIEQRHESVAKKQKLTAGAFDEMRESGGKVLQGTPKKGAKAVK